MMQSLPVIYLIQSCWHATNCLQRSNRGGLWHFSTVLNLRFIPRGSCYGSFECGMCWLLCFIFTLTLEMLNLILYKFFSFLIGCHLEIILSYIHIWIKKFS